MKDDDRQAPPLDGEPDEGGGEIIGNCIAIPPGVYEVRYMYYATSYFRDSAKVKLYCAVVEPESYAGTPVERYYNVDELKGPPRKYGGFKAGAMREITREIRLLMGEPKRLDRISFVGLRGKRLLAELVTVTHDHRKRPLSLCDQYSKIDRFVGILPDEDW